MAFDRRSSSFFVADGGANAGGVWRMHWNPATATIDAAVRIAHLGEDRATGLALAPTGPIGSRRQARQRGVPDDEGLHGGPADRRPAGRCSPHRPSPVTRAAPAPPPWRSSTAATSTSPRTSSPTTTIPPSRRRSSRRTASAGCRSTRAAPPSPSAGSTEASRTPSRPTRSAAACTWGTATGDLVDHVDVLDVDSGRVETYETGFTSVSAMGVEADGDLLVADDPGAGALVVDSAGMGRIGASACRRSTGRRLPSPPARRSRATTPARPSPTRRARACSSSAVSTAPPTRPARVGAGSVSYDALMEGVHAFDVRAIDPAPGSTPGRSLRRTFIVDLTAPSVGIDSRLDGEHRPGVLHCASSSRRASTASPSPAASTAPPPSHAARAGRRRPCASAPTRCASRASISPATPARRPTRQPPSGASSSPRRLPRRPPPPPRPPLYGARRRCPPRRSPAAPRPVPSTRARSGHARRTTIRVVRTAGLRLAPGARPVVNVLFDATPGARFARLTLRDFEGRRPGPRSRQHRSPRQPRRARPHDVAAQQAPGPATPRRSLPPHGGDGPATESALSTVWTGLLRVRPGA